MKTEHRFAEELKKMMVVQPLDDISVLALSKKCKFDRQTFYSHFRDIYDLLTLIYLNEKIEGINEVKSRDELLSILYTYYEKNASFIDATLSSAGKDLVLEFFYNKCYTAFLKLVLIADKDRKLSLNDRKILARYYASAYSYSIVYYLSSHKHKTKEGLFEIFAFINKDELTKATNNMIKIRSNRKENK